MRNDDDDEDDEDYMDNDEVDRRGGNGAGRRSGGQATMSSSSGSDPFLSNLLGESITSDDLTLRLMGSLTSPHQSSSRSKEEHS